MAQFQFLGTGTSVGVPMLACSCDVCTSENPKDRRTRSSAFIRINDVKLLIDAGPDIRAQLLAHNIVDLDGVLLTHEHNDHVVGLDDLRPICYLQNKQIPVYAEPRTLENVNQRFPYLFTQNSFGTTVLSPLPIAEGLLSLHGLNVEAIRIDHGNMPILGFRFGSLAYITDAKFISAASLEKLQDLDVLIINALQVGPHFKHLNLEEALHYIALLKPKQTYLTHLSHRIGLHDRVNTIIPQNVKLAYDGLIVEFSS